jgi:KDO2-lipid IV(A) lauroyltransferase
LAAKIIYLLALKNLLEYIAFLFFVKIAQLFGFKKLHLPAKFLTFLFFNILKIRREVVKKNLSIAFPDKSDSELENISHKSYYHFSRLILEIMCIPKMSSKEMLELIDCDEIPELRDRYQEGRGLIFLTAHFGNWEIGAMSVPMQMGTIMYPIIKPQRNPYVTKWLKEMREVHGNKVIPLGISIREIYKVLKEGKLLGVVGDQRGPKEAMRVKLFGKDTAVYTGTAEMVLKLDVPIYVLFATRIKGAEYKAYTERIDLRNLPEDKTEQVKEINQRYMQILEKHIIKYPEQWFWMHNIWKY